MPWYVALILAAIIFSGPFLIIADCSEDEKNERKKATNKK